MLQTKPVVAVIGGGAAGLVTSIVIKEKLRDECEVIILERLERVGKKILATGGGKANITNMALAKNPVNYNINEFLVKFFKKYNAKETIRFFETLGLSTITLQEGRVYPRSESANSVLDVLRFRIKDLDIKEMCNFDVKRITSKNNKYLIESSRASKVEADYVVMATGGKSSSILGSNGSGYELLKRLKVDITPILPGLTGLKIDENQLKGLDGLRYKALVKVFMKKEKEPKYKEFGEIQFKANALSGIVMMNVSSFISRSIISKTGMPSHIMIDLMDGYDEAELKLFLEVRKIHLQNYTNVNFLIGIFPKMLVLNILKRARIPLDGNVCDLNLKDLERLVYAIKKWEVPYKDLDSFEHSQVSVGGVELYEVNDDLELYKCPNMYVAGELLNIDGLCGGYNLQWAWTSSKVVGNAIIKKITKGVK